jgi:predicted dehydrogenase
MKQIIQSLKTGDVKIADVAAPLVRSGYALIESSCSLISTGTEKMLVDFGKANIFQKISQQPDKVRMVLDKVKTDGFNSTYQAVKNKIDQPMAMGYSNVGKIIALGTSYPKFKIGDRVVSNSKHAEFVVAPFNLCAKIPNNVSDESASFTVLGSIALHSVRLANPSLGEKVVVIGLGLVGLLAVQIFRAHGCRVLGIDSNQKRLQLANQFGAETVDLSRGENPLEFAEKFTHGIGVDAVVIAASTDSNLPIHQAAAMSRKRGRIVLVGTAGLNLSRADFYEKEISFQVSCSYGPGRYDKDYEENGQDYPIGYVRWTEQRNFEAILEMLEDKTLNVDPLISHRIDIENAKNAYDLFQSEVPPLGILLRYSCQYSQAQSVVKNKNINVTNFSLSENKKATKVNFIGSGNFALTSLMPNFKICGAILRTVISATGVSGWYAANKFGFEYSSTDPNFALGDPVANTIVVATRHDSHAKYVIEALNAGKNVFVEKPLALSLDDLSEISSLYNRMDLDTRPILMVGFNRRFSPQVLKMKELIGTSPLPVAITTTINAGYIDGSSWTQDLSVGGGRIIGEACHFIDLVRFLAGSEIESWSQKSMLSEISDTLSIQMRFKNGSIGTINYFSNGSKSFPKETLEVFTSGKVLRLDNYKMLTGYGWPTFKKNFLWKQNKGHNNCIASFLKSVQGLSPAPIPFEELEEVTRVSIQISQSLR